MRLALIGLGFTLLLSGCEDVMGNFASVERKPRDPSLQRPAPLAVSAQATPQPTMAQPASIPPAPNDGFCRAVAQQDATRIAYDAATQQRILQRSYAQCLALHGGR